MKFKLPAGNEIVVASTDGGYVVYDNIDLTGISKLKVNASVAKGRTVGGTLEVRADSPTGPKLGSAEINEGTMGEVEIPLQVPADRRQRNLYLVFKNANADNKPLYSISTLEFMNGAM